MLLNSSRFHALNRRQVAFWLLLAAFLYGLLSAICWPSTYTLSHMVIDYHYGVGKRGLIGYILGFVDHPPYHYVTLAWMAFGVLLLWLICLIFAARTALRSDTGVISAYVLFFLSAGFASLVDDVGRGEHFGLLLALICFFLPCRPAWLVPRAALLMAAVLIQEMNFLFIVPTVAFDTWLGRRSRSRFEPVICAAATVIPAILLTWYLGNIKTACDTTSATAFYQRMVADFQFQPVPVATLCKDGRANLWLVWQAVWSDAASAVAFPLALSAALPSMLLNLVLTIRSLGKGAFGATFAIVSTLSPIALLLVGADVTRFVTLLQASSLLVLVSAVRRVGIPFGGTLPPHAYRVPLLMALAAFELGTSVTLTDGTQALKFPFMPLIVRAVEVAQGRAAFVVAH